MKVIISFMLFSIVLFADCSKYIGSFSINEVYKPGMMSGGDPFVELVSIDGTDFNSSWKIRLETDDGTYEYSLVAPCDSDEDYVNIKLNDKDEIDLENGMSITFIDADGNYIDYLVMNDHDLEGHLGDCNYEYDTNVDTSDVSFLDDSDTKRDPDGTGDWISENDTAMMSSNNTDCDSNDGSSKIYINDDGDTDGDDDSCDEPKYHNINDALQDIRDNSDNGPFKLVVCTGDYNENLNFDNKKFDGLILKGKGDAVNIKNDADVLVTVDNSDINKISFYNINFDHNVTGDDCDDSKFIFDFKTNSNSADAKIKIGNIPFMNGRGHRSFNFGSSDFAGSFSFSGFNNFKSRCSAIEMDSCDSDKESFDFKSFRFQLNSDKTDKFGFWFGDDVKKECNISMASIDLDMNQSAGIRFKERNDFTLDGFKFKNSTNDASKYAFRLESMPDTNYQFKHFNIDSSGVGFDLGGLNDDVNLTLSIGLLQSRNNQGLVINDKIKYATITNVTFNTALKPLGLSLKDKSNISNLNIYSNDTGVDIRSDGDGLLTFTHNIIKTKKLALKISSGDLNITDVNITSDGCGFDFGTGTPMFDGLHINAGDCDYSFKKSTYEDLSDKSFIKDSTFGLKKTGADTYPLDWNSSEISLTNSCFCPKKRDDSGAINRKNTFQADGNFWKYLDADSYEQDGFKDDDPIKDGCPIDGFEDVCAVPTISGFIAYTAKNENNISDSNFTTQKYGDTVSYYLSSISDTNSSAVKDFNGTVCYYLYSDSKKTDWVKLNFDDQNSSDELNTTLTFSTKIASFFVKWVQNQDLDCDDDGFDDNGTAPEQFAIIPSKFVLDINASTLRAGTNYNIEINATDNDGNKVDTYNQTFSDQDKNISLFFINTDDSQDFNRTYDMNETNGTGSIDDYKIDDVGKYLIKIIDTEYAKVDQNDTNLSQRTIEGNITINVIPHHFDVNITKHQTSTSQDWAYMSQDGFSDMNYTFEATLTAKNEANETTKAFDKDLYAVDINTTINFDRNLSDGNLSKYIQYNNDFSISGTTGEFNTSKSTFTKGVSKLNLIYKIDKNTTTPFAPVRTTLKNIEINVSSDDDHIESIDDNITWYYSKIKTFDIVTTKDTSSDKFVLLIYKEDKNNLKQISLNWYQNTNDTTTFESDDLTPAKDRHLNNSADADITLSQNSNGEVDFNITKNDDTKARIHINIPPYMWYTYGIDSNYSYDNNSTCSQHPCSNYRYYDSSEENKISTGIYKGGEIKVEDRGKHTKKGIKLFR